MTTITIVTRHPETVADYFGFGCREIERGTDRFGDAVVIASCPDHDNALWNVNRLCSGLHGARIVEDLDAWKEEWGYTPEKVSEEVESEKDVSQETLGYTPKTKSYVLNNLHIMLQEAQNNGGDLSAGLDAIGLTSIDEAFSMIEEVRDNPE